MKASAILVFGAAWIVGAASPAWAQVTTTSPTVSPGRAQFEAAGAAYRNGDLAEAARLTRIAAELGNVDGEAELGRIYFSGEEGLPQNYAEGMRWTRKAADQGLAIAMFNLGTIYENGRAVPKDYVQAHQWYNLAAAHFTSPDLAPNRKFAADKRDSLEGKMTPAQIAEAQRLASEWKPSDASAKP